MSGSERVLRSICALLFCFVFSFLFFFNHRLLRVKVGEPGICRGHRESITTYLTQVCWNLSKKINIKGLFSSNNKLTADPVLAGA